MRMSLLDAINRTARRPLDALEDLGEQLLFYVRSIGWSARTIRRYRRRSSGCWPRSASAPARSR